MTKQPKKLIDSKKDNPLADLFLSLLLPVYILSSLSAPDKLGPLLAFLVALIFPLSLSFYNILYKKHFGLISIFGLINVLLTGGFGLMKLDGIWFAVKEASIPLAIALVLLISNLTKNPIVEKLFLNNLVLDIYKIKDLLAAKNKSEILHNTLHKLNYFIFASFILSAVLNFLLAFFILQSPTGSEQFNKELAKMHILSYPIIALPCTIVLAASFFWFLSVISKNCNIPMQALFSENIIGKIEKSDKYRKK